MHCAYISIPTFKLIQRYSPNVAMYLAEIVLHVMYLYQLLCKGSKSLRRNIYMCCQPSKRDWLHRFLQSVICSSTKDLLLANHRCKLFSTKKLLFFQIRVHSTFRWHISEDFSPTFVALLNFKQNIANFPSIVWILTFVSK